MAGKKLVIPGPKKIAEAVVYLTEATRVAREVLHLDNSAQVGRW
jgi:hypothetical protein